MFSRAAAGGAIARRNTAHRRRSTIASYAGRSVAYGNGCSASLPNAAIGRGAGDRLDAHQGTPLGLGRKKGERSQAIGRSRGGRNTKIHAIADAKGRLLSILLSGGEAHDCPPAKRLIRRTKPARKLLGDRAYDSAPQPMSLTRRAPD